MAEHVVTQAYLFTPENHVLSSLNSAEAHVCSEDMTFMDAFVRLRSVAEFNLIFIYSGGLIKRPRVKGRSLVFL